MDENRIAGTAKNMGGKIEEGFGRVTGDTKTQAKGVANRAVGAAQDLYGQARNSASDALGLTARRLSSIFLL
ncbi:MAG: CsbD family protein [Xanthobacteraceae bacterium]